MKEIGGYIELEHFSGSLYHDSAIALNCGRGCLRYLVEARQITSIWIPFFLCDSVQDTLEKCHVEVKKYRVSPDFQPVFDFAIKKSDYLYLVDYYGQLTDETVERARGIMQERVIVDETQNFFARPRLGIDTLYTTRKYFGVPDGGFLYTDAAALEGLEQDESRQRVEHLIGRLECNASSFYSEARANNEIFATHPARFMSEFTKNILRAIDFNMVIEKRNANYDILDASLRETNDLSTTRCQGPFAYPLLVKDGPSIRKKLAEQKIYIPTLWPNVAQDDCGFEEVSYARNILPLPVDQRYGKEEMLYIIDALRQKGIGQ